VSSFSIVGIEAMTIILSFFVGSLLPLPYLITRFEIWTGLNLSVINLLKAVDGFTIAVPLIACAIFWTGAVYLYSSFSSTFADDTINCETTV
jgi:hypothetical protein